MSIKTSCGTEHENLHELLQCEYNETDIPDMIIKESNVIKKLTQLIITQLDPHLKVSFTDKIEKELITTLEEDYEVVEILREVTDGLLNQIILNDGHLEITEPTREHIDSTWYFKDGWKPETIKQTRERLKTQSVKT
jgi:hypothetical protein